MDKYRVLTKYPKPITNSGRLVTLQPGAQVYLKKEGQVKRLLALGIIEQIIELPKKKKPKKPKTPKKKERPEPKEEEPAEPKAEPRRERRSRRQNRKNQGE